MTLPGGLAPAAVIMAIQWFQVNPDAQHISIPEEMPFKQIVRVYQVTGAFRIYNKQTELRARILDHVAAQPLSMDELTAYWETFKDDAGAVKLLVRRLVELNHEGKVSMSKFSTCTDTQPELAEALRLKIEEHTASLLRHKQRNARQKAPNDFPERDEKRRARAAAATERYQQRLQDARDGLRVLSEEEVAWKMGRGNY